MIDKRKKILKSAATALLCVIVFILLAVVGYLLYVIFEYNRIEDNLSLQTESPKSDLVQTDTEYSALTYNVGFGAYSPEFSFFLDSATTVDGKKVDGKFSRAVSKQEAQKNTEGAARIMREADADFILIQEVDEKGHRSRFVNQREAFALDGYSSTFAVNFHSAYLLFPFNDPIGKSLSGIQTLSRFRTDSAVRISLPLSTGFSKFFDLDRCITVSRLPVEGSDKHLVLINVHLSAYDKGGVIRKQQTDLLFDLLEDEAEIGNYVLVGGDFNQLLYQTDFPTTQPYNSWAFPFPKEELPSGYAVYSDIDTPTCRNANMPYKKGESYTCVIDGFIVSQNLSVSSVHTASHEFEYSDHNPVKISFTLN